VNKRLTGYATWTEPTTFVECDTFTCGHCQRIVHVKPKQSPESLGGLCYGCDRLVCDHCAGKGCDVIEKKIERYERKMAIRRSYG
jgi:hypothetical protein